MVVVEGASVVKQWHQRHAQPVDRSRLGPGVNSPRRPAMGVERSDDVLKSADLAGGWLNTRVDDVWSVLGSMYSALPNV